MTDITERVALTQQRIESYQDIQSTGGHNGAVVRELGRLAEITPMDAFRIADSLDPSLRASALTTIGKVTGDISPIFEARSIVEGIRELELNTRSRKLSHIALAARGLDDEFALDTARQIGWTDLKADTLIRLADRGTDSSPDTEILREAMDTLERSKARHKDSAYYAIGELAGKVDLSLAETAFNHTRHGGRYWHRETGLRQAVKHAINERDYYLITQHKAVVVRALTSVFEYDPRRVMYAGAFDRLNPLEDSVSIIRWFSDDPETHAKLVEIITRAAQATENQEQPWQQGVLFDPITGEPTQ